VAVDSIEAARDGDNAKEDLVELILEQHQVLQQPSEVPRGGLSPSRMRTLAGLAGRFSPTHAPEPEPEAAGYQDGKVSPGVSFAPGHNSPQLFRTAALLGRLSPSLLVRQLSREEAATVIQTEWRGYDARLQFVSRRKLHLAQLEEIKRAERELAVVILEELLDEFMPEIAPAFLARAVPAACASLAASHVVKSRSKQSGPAAVADIILQE
jgi:hypothetical protein